MAESEVEVPASARPEGPSAMSEVEMGLYPLGSVTVAAVRRAMTPLLETEARAVLSGKQREKEVSVASSVELGSFAFETHKRRRGRRILHRSGRHHQRSSFRWRLRWTRGKFRSRGRFHSS